MRGILLANMNRELIAIYTEKGFILDTEITKSKQYYTNDKLLADSFDDSFKALLYFSITIPNFLDILQAK